MNILWLTVDSMRSYKCDIDDRGRIPFFDVFCENAIEFTNCYCSAPSTVMSVSSMMTAIPAVYHSASYDNFDKNSLGFETFPDWLTQNGFVTRSIVFFPEGREHLTHLMGDTLKRYWPKHKDKLFWSNKDIYQTFLSALGESDLSKNNFYYVHFNIRHDPNTNDWVEKCYKEFMKNAGENIIVLTSDHGYPDPSRGITQAKMIFHGHDLLLTNDNVKVPLAIKVNSGVKKKINNLASLIDIAPTLQRLINNELENTLNVSFLDCGIDLFSQERKELQISNRYILQKNMQTKYIIGEKHIILNNNSFFIEKDLQLKNYCPTVDELSYISKKQEFLFDHFKKFFHSKAKKLEKKSLLFTSTPPPNSEKLFEKLIQNGIQFTSKAGCLKGAKKIYVIKSSENLLKTIDDVNLAKNLMIGSDKIEVLSLNLDPIRIRHSKIMFLISLFKNKFLPRFINNPLHTVREVIIIVEKLLWPK